MNTRRLVQFGDFTLDSSQGLLYRHAQRMRVPPKLIELLTLLVERRGDVVTHAELVRALWPNTVVEEGGLSRNISILRKHLSCGGETQYIENIPKRGYRFTAPVREVCDSAPEPVAPMFQATPCPALSVAADVSPVELASKVRATPRGWRRYADSRLLIGFAILISVALTVLATQKKEDTPGLTMEPMTRNAAALPVLTAAISPDARYLAYVESTQSGAAAFVRLVDSPRVHALQSLPSVVPSTIRWYSDNIHLLLSGFDPSSRQYVAWSTSVLGAPATIVLTNAYKPALSPDAKLIAFYRERELWLADSTGGSQRAFARASGGSRFSLQPQFSGDGKYLVVGRAQHPYSPVIEAHRLDGREVKVLFDPKGQGVLDMLVLPTDELILSTLLSRSRTRLLSMRIDFASGRVSAPQTLAELDGLAYRLHASGDGREITLVRDPGQTDIYLGSLDPAGTSLTQVRRLTFDDGRDRPSAWLDDNHTIVFHSDRHGRRAIYKQRIDALHPEPLVLDEHDNIWPTVSPDQRWLWYYSMEPDAWSSEQRVRLMRRPLAGGPATDFGARPDPWRGLRCSKSGRCIRAEHEGAETIFYSFDPEDGTGRELARAPWASPMSYYNWDISPDGDRIAFIDRAQNVIGLLSLDIKPPQRTDLSVDGDQSLQAISWDAAGLGLYVACFDEDDSSTLHVSLDGRVQLLRHQPLGIGGWASPSPDGRHLLIADWTRSSNVWLLERKSTAASFGTLARFRHVR